MPRPRKRTRRPPTPKPPFRAPKDAAAFARLSTAQQQTWTDALEVLNRVRSDEDFREAAAVVGISIETVQSLIGSTLKRDGRGRVSATRTDALFRLMVIPGTRGLREVAPRDSRTASRLGAYAAAVQKYLARGDAADLRTFRTEVLVGADGRRIQLLTNLDSLDRLGHAGALSFESIYSR